MSTSLRKDIFFELIFFNALAYADSGVVIIARAYIFLRIIYMESFGWWFSIDCIKQMR